jgi:haloalkane dehalogenase
MRKVLTALSVLLVFFGIVIFLITRPGELVTPEGTGVLKIGEREFEAYPLPDYAKKLIDEDYKSYLVEVEPGIKVHVLEVGTGFPVFMQHGNPTSGFLYRKVAAELPRDRVRMIMPTLVGLGFSSKVPVHQHTIENHIDWIGQTLKTLGIKELVYVGQDWGGPIGMGALAESPDLIKGAVVMNTGFNAPKEPMDLSQAHATAKTPVAGELLLEVILSIFEQLPNVQGDPASMPAEVVKVYEQPLLDSGNRKAPLTLMRMVTDGPEHQSAEAMRKIESYVRDLDIPVEIIWGMNDPILGKSLPVMRANFPDAPATETEAGHFLQEEVPDQIAAAVLRVIERIKAKSSVAHGEAMRE